MTSNTEKPVDVLSELAAAFHLEGAMSGSYSLSPPWGHRVPKRDAISLLVVVRGRAHFELLGERGRSLELGPGDVVALPHGDAHVIADDPCSPLEDIGELSTCFEPRTDRYRSGQTELLLLACRFSDGANNPLLRALPPLIHYAGHEGAVARSLGPTFQLLASESGNNALGRTVILDRLAEVVFLQLIRTWIEDEHECQGKLRSLKDSGIAQTLSAMHHEPGRAWTIEALAERAGMSRSTFASRFRELVGETPLHYLTRWRMQRAAVMLRSGKAPLKEVVGLSGYGSEAAFRTAFRKWMGESPGSYRAGIATLPSRAP